MSVLVRIAEPSDRRALARLIGVVQALHVARRPETFRTVPGPELAETRKTRVGIGHFQQARLAISQGQTEAIHFRWPV